jgi:hypothetical protein
MRHLRQDKALEAVGRCCMYLRNVLTETCAERYEEARAVGIDVRHVLALAKIRCPRTTLGAVLSREAISRVVIRHTGFAAESCPSIAAKKVKPQTLRHSCAMRLFVPGWTWLSSPLTSARINSDHRHPPACQPRPKGTSPRPHRSDERSSWSLPTRRHPGVAFLEAL